MPRAVTDGGENLDDADITSWVSSHRCMDSTGYRIGFPPKKGLLEEFSSTVKDMFFAGDDLLRQYKEQPSWSKRAWLSLQYVFPVLNWGRHYSLGKFKGDLIAGLTIASLCVPQDIGYSKLANLQPEIGLYSSFVPPLIYPLMGSSRDIAMGLVAVVLLMLGTLLQNEFDPKKHPLEYRRLAFTTRFFAGITQAALGFFRLGLITEFLSHAAIVGFMVGAAITIVLQQLKGFLGIRNFTANTDIVSVMKLIGESAHHGWNWQTILIGGFGRPAVNCMAGCKTAASNIVMSIVAPLTLLFITPLFKYTPNAILCSIIISAVLGLIDYKAAYLIWKVNKLDFLACLEAFFGVVFSSVDCGLLILYHLPRFFSKQHSQKQPCLGTLNNTQKLPESQWW